MGMTPICQTVLPADMQQGRALPGIQPVKGPWLSLDEAYAGQMARREALLRAQEGAVLHMAKTALAPCNELLDLVLEQLAPLGFEIDADGVTCPDGRIVAINRAAPLATLGRLVQQDFCLLERQGDEHVLEAAVLCFPASWMLSEKAGRSLIEIHEPVNAYTHDIARRVQRLFDGVQVGRPLWRFNQLWYVDPELHQPRSAFARRDIPETAAARYFRTERQTVLRLPESKWVVFMIHTLVLEAGDVPQDMKDKAGEIETVAPPG